MSPDDITIGDIKNACEHCIATSHQFAQLFWKVKRGEISPSDAAAICNEIIENLKSKITAP